MRVEITIILGVTLLCGVSRATVDVANATNFRPIPDNPITFNITHKQWRHTMMSGRQSVPIWLNPYQMPESVSLYKAGHWEIVTNADTIYALVLKNAMRTLREWGVETFQLSIRDYYQAQAKYSRFRNGKSLVKPNKSRSISAFPLEVHFRYPPYPQSSFGEFVTNRKVPWRLWHDMEDYQFSSHIGKTDDLVYRMRHNFGHSLGLGHTESKDCIMYPTNVEGLSRFCPEERRAMDVLLREHLEEHDSSRHEQKRDIGVTVEPRKSVYRLRRYRAHTYEQR